MAKARRMMLSSSQCMVCAVLRLFPPTTGSFSQSSADNCGSWLALAYWTPLLRPSAQPLHQHPETATAPTSFVEGNWETPDEVPPAMGATNIAGGSLTVQFSDSYTTHMGLHRMQAVSLFPWGLHFGYCSRYRPPSRRDIPTTARF